ncbi:hypothetical protein ACPCA8_34285 [Streptomyces capoamus]|uniref:hypothetical protein n=1 Tax=Streptomyces capoamus TaxID=68183 RepID=UPI003C2C0283
MNSWAEDVLGDGLDAHERRVAQLTGTPLAVVRDCDALNTDTLRDVGRAPSAARPAGCASADAALSEAPAEGAVWCRTGDVFAVHAAGNSPGVHAMWLEALALGYRVVVRPSQRDPRPPFRLVTALRGAGVPPTQLIRRWLLDADADQPLEHLDLRGVPEVAAARRRWAGVDGAHRAREIVGRLRMLTTS